MKIKHFDDDLQKWIVAGVSNADDLELTNPALTDEEGNSISANQGFTKIINRLNKIEDNVAWIYLNGALGGGSGGTGGSESIKIEIVEGSTIYTSTGVVKFNMLINNGTTSRSFTIVIRDIKTGKIYLTTKKYSLTRIPIEISGISENVELEISAYDSSENFAVPTYLNIIYGAIRLDLQSTPSKTITRGGISQVPANFTLTSNVLGAVSSFIFKVGDIVIDEVTNITTSTRSLNYNLRDILFNRGLFPGISAGSTFIFTAQGTTQLGDSTINSNIITFDVTVVEADSLVIVTNNISETDSEYEEITKFSQGSQLNFVYYLSYAPTKYNTFNIEYNIYKMSDGVKLSETPIIKGLIPNVNKNINHVFSLSTVDFDLSEDNEYLMVELKGSSVSDPGDTSAHFTKNVYAVIRQAEKVDLYANNDINTLLAYYSRVSGFPVSTATEWVYNLSETGRFPYIDEYKSQFPDGVKMKLHKTNGSSTGFISNTDYNNTPGIVLNGESYANIEVAKQMFPDLTVGEFGFFNPKGFNISMTYKTDAMTDPERVVMSIGNYRNDVLYSGIEITLEKIIVKVGTADNMEVKLPINEIITVDIDVSLLGGGWYFKIFINGVMSSVIRVTQSNIDWTFEEDIYLGCRNDKGNLSRFSNVTIYDFKLYTSSQTDFAIVQNYISATEQANLLNGSINESLDAELRAKNLFDSEGRCLIWNSGTNSYYEGEPLYNILSSEMETNTPYPIVMIREATNSATDFKAFSTAVFSSDSKDEIMDKTFPATITFKNKLGEATIQTPNGVAAAEGVRVGLQGTSSLSYNAKNYELYMGNADATGKHLLFQPTHDWLPENRFTLKADVMDSAHVNNVVVGKIINGEVINEFDEQVVPLHPTPPMLLSDNLFASPEMADEVRSKIKHTSDGFPCLVFIDFAPDRKTGLRETRFLGIYNFNLGRHAQFNLGLKILTDYTREVSGGQPTVVSEYSETSTYWNTSVDRGVYSMEINQNHSEQGAFQQDDMQIIKFMADAVYSSQDEDRAYDAVRKFYTQMANTILSPVQKYTMDDAGQTPNKIIPGAFYTPTDAYYRFSELDTRMYWDNAVAYFVLGIVFGMVDSMCKNLTLRSWGGDIWYTTFYDMDTSFGLNNSGQDIVEYWAHLHRWYNIASQDTGITTFAQEKNYTDSNADGIKQYYASTWSRIWEILENMPLQDPGEVDVRTTIEKMYVDLRLNLFPDPEEFIDKYYKSYTEQTGSIMFNYDYNIKYLKIAQKYNSNTDSYEDTTDFSQLKFLHGNRVIHVKDWFRKRIMFLDGVYGIKGKSSMIDASIASPMNQMWGSNKVTAVSGQPLFDIQMAAESKILYRWAYDQTNGSFWLDTPITNVVVPAPGGETVLYVYANRNITHFGNFKGYPWTNLTTIDLPKLRELDLSGLKNIPAANLLYPKVYDSSNNVGLKNIEKLDLSNVIVTNASNFTLDTTDCLQLQHLNIANSNITNVVLDPNAALKYYNLSNTAIDKLVIENQSFLTDLIINGCNNLTEITINNCNSLTYLNLPPNVKKLTITNCESLDSINLPYTGPSNLISSLETIIIDNCPGLKTFNIQGQNNQSLNVSLIGAWNLEHLNVSYTQSTNIVLPSLYVEGIPYFKSLKTLNISNSNITHFKFNDDDVGDPKTYLDLTAFDNFQNISASNNTEITEIRFKNIESDPIELGSQAFLNCSNLRRVKGHFKIVGWDTFRNNRNFKLNEESVYAGVLPNEFLIGDDVTNISLATSNMKSVFEGCNTLSFNDFKRIVEQFNPQITTLEATFKDCNNISGEIWRDFFSKSRNVDNIKDFLLGTSIRGTIVSTANDYNINDESTWGFFDYLPNLKNLESAFENSSIEWIDNNLFRPKNGVSYKFAVIDNLFRYCSNLRTCEDSRALNKVQGRLNSKTFFTNLLDLLSLYPKFVFTGTRQVDMNIINEGENTFLFHTRKTGSHNELNNSLYSGVNLYGEVKLNLFGGQSNTIISGSETFNIPKFTSIQSPFRESGGKIDFRLSEMGDLFQNMGNSLLQLRGAFAGMSLIGTKTIPNNLFKGCSKLNSIEGLFANLDLDNNGEIYEFPNSELFKDNIALSNVSRLFAGNKNLKIKLIPEGFINCNLEDVSEMFSRSKVFGTIPFRFFHMERNRQLRRTIKKMDNIFNNCWLLGYTSDREIDEETLLETVEYSDGSVYNRYITWDDGVAKSGKEGQKVSFKLDVSNMEKTFNYDRDENLTIPNPNYIENVEDRPEDYDPLTPETIPNPEYNPGEYAFDIWYLDGYGWEGALAKNSSQQADLNAQKLRLDRYFKYDNYQKQSILDHENLNWYIDSYQNYAIPTDIFRYCHKDATLINVLKNISWNKRAIEIDPATNKGVIIQLDEYEGLLGRIPLKIFDALVDNTELSEVFNSTRFTPFYGMRGTDTNNIIRGTVYPPGLFDKNLELQRIPYMFASTKIPVGVDINPELFKNNSKLSNISGCWSNCEFDNRDYNAGNLESSRLKNAQIDFNEIFRYNNRISNASNLFAVTNITGSPKGLHIIDSNLLRTALQISDISNMFYYNQQMYGSVPTFLSTIYTFINGYGGYLSGVSKGQISNATSLEARLIPNGWE